MCASVHVRTKLVVMNKAQPSGRVGRVGHVLHAAVFSRALFVFVFSWRSEMTELRSSPMTFRSLRRRTTSSLANFTPHSRYADFSCSWRVPVDLLNSCLKLENLHRPLFCKFMFSWHYIDRLSRTKVLQRWQNKWAALRMVDEVLPEAHAETWKIESWLVL